MKLSCPFGKKSGRVTGLVDAYHVTAGVTKQVVNYESLLYNPEALAKVRPEDRGEVMRQRLAFAETEMLCVRPDWNETPQACYLIPEVFRPYVRIGDRVDVKAKFHKDEVDAHCLGTVQSLLKVNGRDPVDNEERPNWALRSNAEVRKIGETPLSGFLRNLTIATNTAFGRGDRVVVLAPPQVGKSTLLQQVAQSVAEHENPVKIIMILSERPEEVHDYLSRVPANAEVFIALEGVGPLQKIVNAVLGLERAMRCGENEEDVVVIIDSVSKALVYPITAFPVPDGQGIQAGGMNPLTDPLLTACLGIGGNTDKGSITIVAAFLDEGDVLSSGAVAVARRVSTVVWTLSSSISGEGVYPAFDFSLVENRRGQNIVEWPGTSARLGGHWLPSGLVTASRKLQHQLSFQTCRDEEITRSETEQPRPMRDTVDARARASQIGKWKKVIQLAEAGLPPQAILANFGITSTEGYTPPPPGDRPIPVVNQTKSEEPEPPVQAKSQQGFWQLFRQAFAIAA